MTTSSVPLTWDKATDNEPPDTALEYIVYYTSTDANQVNSLVNIDAGGGNDVGKTLVAQLGDHFQ